MQGDIGFTSEDFYNRYMKNMAAANRGADVTQSVGAQQQGTYQTTTTYTYADTNNTAGNFTTALNAPRLVPGQAQGTTYVTSAATQNGAYGSTTQYQLGRGYSIQGGQQVTQQQQFTTGQSGYALQNTQQPVNRQRESNITRIQPPLSLGQTQVRQQVVPGSTTIRSSQVKEGQVIKGQSRIEYIPFQNTVVDYETREWTEKVPVQKKVIEYEEKRTFQQVPREVTKTDYYAVEYIKEYIPQVVPETIIEMVPVEKVVNKTHYVPIETQIIHNPDGTKTQGQSRILYQPQDTLPAGRVQGQSAITYQTTNGVTVPVQVQGQSRIIIQPTQNIAPQPVRSQSRILIQQQPAVTEQVVYTQQPQYVTAVPTEQVVIAQQPQYVQQPQYLQVSNVAQEAPVYYIQSAQTTTQPIDSRVINYGGQSQMVISQAPTYQQVLVQQPYQQEVIYQDVSGGQQFYVQPQGLRQSVSIAQPQQVYGIYPEQQVVYQQPQYLQQSQYIQQPQYVQQQYIVEPQVYQGQQIIQQGQQVIQQVPFNLTDTQYLVSNPRYSAQVDKYISNMEGQYRR